MSATSIIKVIQARLVELYGPTSYYTKSYAPVESGYWGDIPTWMEAAAASASDLRQVRTLDIGPGYGTLAAFAHYLTNSIVDCADRRPYINAEVAKEIMARIWVTDVERELSGLLRTDVWDLIIMTEVLEHFNFHPVRTLRCVASSLKVTGRLFLSTPDAASWGRLSLYKDLDDIPPFDSALHSYSDPPWQDRHIYQYNALELAYVLAAAGLKVHRQGVSKSAGGRRHLTIEARRA